MTTIDVSHLDLNTLIKALWKNMFSARYFSMSDIAPPPEPSNDEINRTLGSRKYIDYLAGRCIKTDFSDLSKVNTRLYNRNAGDGAFERIVAELSS